MAQSSAALAVRQESTYSDNLTFTGSAAEIQTRLINSIDPYHLDKRFNSGKTFTFVKKRNDFLGEQGWRPKQIPHFDPVLSGMVLHDLWEHSPGSPPTPIEEYMAIGAAFRTRVEGGYFVTTGARPSDALARAFGMLFYHAQILADRSTTPCPNIEAAHKPIENTDTEMELIRAVAKAHEYISGNAILQPRTKPILESMKYALPWMRVGYRKAAHRFDGIDVRRLSDVYLKTTKKLEELINSETEVSITTRLEKYEVVIKVGKSFTLAS